MISKSRSTHRAMTKKHPSSSSQGRLLLRPSQEGGGSLAGTPAARSRLPASEQGQWLQSASPLHLPVTWLCCPLSTSLLPALQLPLLCCDYFLSSFTTFLHLLFPSSLYLSISFPNSSTFFFLSENSNCISHLTASTKCPFLLPVGLFLFFAPILYKLIVRWWFLYQCSPFWHPPPPPSSIPHRPL